VPTLDDTLANNLRLRLIAYGPGKTRKTWWAATAAEVGFNVILLDGEQGSGILKQIQPEARKRIYVLDVQDTQGKAVMAEALTWMCKLRSSFYDEVKKQRVTVANENCIQFDWSRLDSNTVVILDSYSALTWSLVVRYCAEQQIDLSDAQKTDWDGYAWCGNLATWLLQQLSLLPCHLIVIGHQQAYEKYSGNGRDRKLDWTRMQMRSTSGPHAMQIAKMFDDVLYFTIQGQTTYIDARPAGDRDGGSRNLSPKRYTFDEFKFKDLCKEAGVALPPKDLIGVKELLQVAQTERKPSATSSISTAVAPAKTAALATSMAKPNLGIGTLKSTQQQKETENHVNVKT